MRYLNILKVFEPVVLAHETGSRGYSASNLTKVNPVEYLWNTFQWAILKNHKNAVSSVSGAFSMNEISRVA